MKPIVAVVGRPNVGKSTLFNKLAGHRISIVEDTPGVTRDRIYAEAEWLGNYFTIIDTGGIELKTEEVIPSKMREQAEIAMETAHVILFLVDRKSGLTPQDREIATLLRRTKKPVLLVVNKVDGRELPADFYDFYELGFGEPFAISAANGLGLGDLLDEILKLFPKEGSLTEEEDRLKIALVGKPNAGKSSILNRLLGEERTIVTPIAGTTRDAIDSYLDVGGKKYLLIDTAGIRRKSRINDSIEHFSVLRAMTAIDRSHVTMLIIDAQEGISEQDSKIIGMAYEAGKAIVLVVNKWDLPEKDNHTMKEYTKSIREELPFILHVPILFISALTGQRFHQILETADEVHEESIKRISTGVLNDVIGEAVMLNQPPSDKGKRLKIYYATQIGIQPPSFAFFINDAALFHFSYKRYLENKLREHFGFEGTPLTFQVREKKRD